MKILFFWICMIAVPVTFAFVDWANVPGSDTVVLPTGTATPVSVESGKLKVESAEPESGAAYMTFRYPARLDDPTRNVVCDYFIANWGKANWPGTSARPWSYQIYHRKRLQRGKWVCDVSRGLEEVNGP